MTGLQIDEELTIDPEFEAFIPPLDIMDFARLKSNIVADGCREPIVVWNGTILDGHNRYKICTENGIPFSTVEVPSVRTRAEAFVWMYENQLGRRNLEPFMRAEMALKVKPYIEERARERSWANLRKGEEIPDGHSECPSEETGRTNEKLAEKANVGVNTIKRVNKILKEATPEVIEKARSGEISIKKAYETVKPPKLVPPQDSDMGNPISEPVDAVTAEQPEEMTGSVNLDDAFSDGPTLEELIDETQRENEQLHRKIESLSKDDKDAEIARLQDLNFSLSRQIDTLTAEVGAAKNQARYVTSKLREIGKIVGTEDWSEIVSAVRRLKS